MAQDPAMPHPQTIFTKMSMSPKMHSPYEKIMKKFTDDRIVRCRSDVVDVPQEHRPEKRFMTGSKYEGSWDALGMTGPNAIYTFPNGVIFEGDFEDGLRHGMGEMTYPTGEVLRGRFSRGRMVERTLMFADGLEYSETDWLYCKIPDRRFTIEYEEGVQPARKSYMTADLPTRDIPAGYYDTGDGFYNPKTQMVYKADDITAILRAPTGPEQKWIEENCRFAPEEPMGPRSDLYEEWLEPDTDPPMPPLPSAVSKATAWMFESNRSMMTYDSEDSDVYSITDFERWIQRNAPSKFSVNEETFAVKTDTGKSELACLLKYRSAVDKSTFNRPFTKQSFDKKSLNRKSIE